MIKKFNTSKEIKWFINEYKLPKINIDNLNAENLKFNFRSKKNLITVINTTKIL